MKKNYSLQRQYIYRGWILPTPWLHISVRQYFFHHTTERPTPVNPYSALLAANLYALLPGQPEARREFFPTSSYVQIPPVHQTDEIFACRNWKWCRWIPEDFLNSSKAAYRFMGKLLNNKMHWHIPRLINTGKTPTYGRPLAQLKR